MILCPNVVFFICIRQFLDDVINGMAYYEKKLKGEKSAISASHQKKPSEPQKECRRPFPIYILIIMPQYGY